MVLRVLEHPLSPRSLLVHHSLKPLPHRHSAKPKYRASWLLTLFKLTGLFIAVTSKSKNFNLVHSMAEKWPFLAKIN